MNEQFGIATIVQCRAGSSRFKGKALQPIAGRPMLSHVLERAAAIGFPVVLATSVNARDNQVAKLGQKAGVFVYRGDEQDVLARMSEAARVSGTRVAIRVTGDCPLLAPDVATDVLALLLQAGRYLAGKSVIATNDTVRSGWPDGMDVEAFFAEDLHEAAGQATDPGDREHVTPWLRRNLDKITLSAPSIEAPKVKLSVDTPEDFERVKAVYDHLENGQLGWQATFAAVGKAGLERRDGAGRGSNGQGRVVLPPPAVAALKREGLTVESAAALSDSELVDIKGIGPSTVAKIREAGR